MRCGAPEALAFGDISCSLLADFKGQKQIPKRRITVTLESILSLGRNPGDLSCSVCIWFCSLEAVLKHRRAEAPPPPSPTPIPTRMYMTSSNWISFTVCARSQRLYVKVLSSHLYHSEKYYVQTPSIQLLQCNNGG